ncbi:MAG TPA: YciI family protein [Conexibacter sp.]|nr:YciI family protein [Conexibacter sp.]
MAKYVYVYKGGKMAETDEERQAAMAAWGAFLGGLGEAVVDAGNPFGASAEVTGDGAAGASSNLTGYSVVTAGSLGEATERAQDCPVLASGGSVEVYETLEVM